MTPSSGTTGSTVTITMTGPGGLAGAQSVRFTPGTGITVVPGSLTSSATQVQVTIMIAAGAPLVSHLVEVEYPTAFFVPSPVPFAVTPLLPTLASASPGTVLQGARDVRLTLLGTNFRAGAQVVISPPLPDPTLSGANQQAADISVTRQSVVSPTMILAVIDVAPDAVVSPRAVDVVNVDGTSTGQPSRTTLGSGTSQRLLLMGGNSLAAPLTAQTVAITHPRNGTILSQADQIYAQAVLAGTGTGTFTGTWLWDGNAFEQFTVNITGGDRVILKTGRSLPTSFLGAHRLELRINAPNQLQSTPVTLIVNPGAWKLEQLIGPAPGVGFLSTRPPVLRWAQVPGAAKYQVGFSAEPHFRSIERWHDVEATEWAVPDRVWQDLPEGELYWTVRVVEVSGDTRRPLPMRRISRLPSGVLDAAQPAPRKGDTGMPLLEWRGLSGPGAYRVTVSRDANGRDIVKRFLTAQPRLELRSLRGQLQSGQTYYWRVEAFSRQGNPVVSGPWQSFVAQDAGPSSHLIPPALAVEVASLGAAIPPQLGQLLARREPGPGGRVSSPRPNVEVEFKSDVTPGDVFLELDDTDVTAMAEVQARKLVFEPILPLAEGGHNLRLVVGAESENWKFTVELKAQPASGAGPGLDTMPGTDAEIEPEAASSSAMQQADAGAEGSNVIFGPEVTTEMSANTQWISGSEADTVVIGMAHRTNYQNGPWRAEANGTGLLNALLSPDPQTARGRVNDYVFQVGYEQPRWGAGVRFGVVAPSLFTNSEFVTTGTPREGVEPVLRTPIGTFGYYNNTNDSALGGGSGVAFHQEIRGASFAAPLPAEHATFRLMWLNASDRSAPQKVCFDPFNNPIPCTDPVAHAGAGDAYGSILQLHLGPSWQWTSEYAWGYNNPNLTSPTAARLFGRAWRTGLSGFWKKTTASFQYRDVGPNFATPANPSLSQLSSPGRRGVDAAVAQQTPVGNLSLAYRYLQSDLHRADRPQISLHDLNWTWSKGLSAATVIGVGGRHARTITGDLPAAVLLLSPAEQLAVQADTRDLGGNVFLTHTVGRVTLGATGSRNWFRNRLISDANIITSGIQLNGNWQALSYFQLNSNFSVNWVAGAPAKIGTARTITTYIQPMFVWQRPQLTLTPLVALTQARAQLAGGTLTNDTWTRQYLGRLSWQMPGSLRFSTLSLEAGNTRVKNAITGMEQEDKRFLLLWTLVWGYHHR